MQYATRPSWPYIPRIVVMFPNAHQGPDIGACAYTVWADWRWTNRRVSVTNNPVQLHVTDFPDNPNSRFLYLKIPNFILVKILIQWKEGMDDQLYVFMDLWSHGLQSLIYALDLRDCIVFGVSRIWTWIISSVALKLT